MMMFAKKKITRRTTGAKSNHFLKNNFKFPLKTPNYAPSETNNSVNIPIWIAGKDSAVKSDEKFQPEFFIF